MQNKEDFQQKYMEFQFMQQQIKQVEKQIDDFDVKVTELAEVSDHLNQLKNVKNNTEMFVAVQPGVYAQAELKDNNKLVVNVGAGIAVEKTIPETINLIKDQMIELSTLRDQLAGQIQKGFERVKELEAELMGLAEQENKNV